MRRRQNIMIAAIVTLLTATIGTGVQVYRMSPAYAQKQQVIESNGASYAKSAGIKNGTMKHVVSEINKVVDVETLSDWENVASVSDDSVLDVRFVNVTDKEGQTYNVAFNGADGSIYGIVNESGENIY